MFHIKSVIFITGVLLINSKSATLHCSHRINEAVQSCVHPVAQYARVLNQQEGQNSSDAVRNDFGQAITLPRIGRYVFRELCRLIREFNDCVYELRQQCPKHVTVSLIDASYGFLCNEGYETFMSSAECLIELDQQPTVKQCHEITLKHIEAANRQLSGTTSNRFDKMCQALNYFSSCVEQPIAHSCGAAAWTMIFRVLRDTTNTLLPGCHFTGHSELSASSLASFQVAEFTTTSPSKHAEDGFPQYREMPNNKAEIIWSNEDITSRATLTSEEKFNIEEKSSNAMRSSHDADPRRNTLNIFGQRSTMGSSRHHVLIDRDTDISYYDTSNVETAASSSNFVTASSSTIRCNAIVVFVKYLFTGWLIFK